MSLIVFNMFTNDLSTELKCTDKGVKIDDKFVTMFACAYDIVLLAESADELQTLLNVIWMRCSDWDIY